MTCGGVYPVNEIKLNRKRGNNASATYEGIKKLENQFGHI